MSSWFRCDCGHTMHTNVFAGASLDFLVPENLLDSFPGSQPARGLVADIVAKSPKVLICPRCSRLYVLDAENPPSSRLYLPERSPTVSLVVLRCADLERSRAFYETLGLSMRAEQHGQGPTHYSALIGSTVLELYPLGTASTAGLRLGLRLSITDEIVQRALAAGGTLVSGQAPDRSSSVVLRDPDGHVIEIERPS